LPEQRREQYTTSSQLFFQRARQWKGRLQTGQIFSALGFFGAAPRREAARSRRRAAITGRW